MQSSVVGNSRSATGSAQRSHSSSTAVKFKSFTVCDDLPLCWKQWQESSASIQVKLFVLSEYMKIIITNVFNCTIFLFNEGSKNTYKCES